MATAPAPAFPFKHRIPIQMRFNDIDALGHVNNSIYLQYMDLGKIQYIYAVLGKNFNYHKESLVIVNLTCEYYQISRYDEPLEVQTRVDNIGDASIIFEQRVSNPETEEVKCICRTVMVGFNADEDKKISIPDKWRRQISAFEGRDL